MQLTFVLKNHEEKAVLMTDLMFPAKPTISEFKEAIQSVFGIEPISQDVFYDGTQLLSCNWRNIELEDGKTVIVKHALLSKFVVLRDLLNVNPKSSEQKRDVARKVRVIKETLDSTKFFDVYSEYYKDVTDAYAEMMRCLNYDPTVIMDSVKRYFGSRNVRYVPEKKAGGSNAGLIFNYIHDGTTDTFYLKANETNRGVNPDARELVVYLLLQQIGIGPSQCYFIPNAAQSKSVVYIATLKVPDFTMAKDLSNPMNETSAVELHLLAVLLNLTDLNTENFGIRETGSLCIVDFSLTKIYQDPSFVDRFKEHVRRQPVLVNLDNCPAGKRMQIAKEAIIRWNLEKAVDQAEQAFMQVKAEITEVDFLDRATGAIKEYLESVRWNLRKLTEMFESTSRP